MKICSVDGCNKSHVAKGFCEKHYTQFKRHGRLTPESEYQMGREGVSCSICNCSNKIHSKGLCRKHYDNFIYHSKRKNINLNQFLHMKQLKEVLHKVAF